MSLYTFFWREWIGADMEEKAYTIKELPESERPYERCQKHGARSLTDAELLAVIIRSGTKRERSVDLAGRILMHSKQYQGLQGLHHLTIKDLMEIRGIGRVKAIQLLCVAELAKRMTKSYKTGTVPWTSPAEIADYYMEDLRHLSQEHCILVFLDVKNRRLGEENISIGTIDSAIISPREIFIHALQHNASAIILLHNHPSGDPSPSGHDIQVTKRLLEAGNFIGIRLMDHIIIGDNNYISLREMDLI